MDLIAREIPNSKIIYCYRNPYDHIIELFKYNIGGYLPLKTSTAELAKIMLIIENLVDECKKRFFLC